MERLEAGFIGLGIMGRNMAAHILKGGYKLTVWNRTPGKAAQLLEAGATEANSPAEVGKRSDVICICAGDGASVREIIFGSPEREEQALIRYLRPGAIIVDHTTISPEEAEALARDTAKEGFRFLDAPVTGGEVGAVNGTLTVMAGGERECLEAIRPLLECYSKKISYVGPSGFGQKLKAVNQIGAICNSAVVSELLGFAVSQGLKIEDTIETLKDGAAGSFALGFFGPRISKGDFSPGFSVKHSFKDITIVLNEAKKNDLPLPVTAVVSNSLRKAVDCGFAEKGNHVLFEILKERK